MFINFTLGGLPMPLFVSSYKPIGEGLAEKLGLVDEEFKLSFHGAIVDLSLSPLELGLSKADEIKITVKAKQIAIKINFATELPIATMVAKIENVDFSVEEMAAVLVGDSVLIVGKKEQEKEPKVIMSSQFKITFDGEVDEASVKIDKLPGQVLVVSANYKLAN